MRAWVIIAALLVMPVAAAGTSDDPEILDASGDSVSTNPALGAGGADLSKAWIQETPEELLVSIELGSAVCADPTETIEYRFFLTASEEVAFGADTFGLGPGFCSLGGSDTTITPTGAATAATFQGSVMVVTVPKSAFGALADGDTLTGFYGTSRAYVGSPAAWNDSDRAPDEGAGRDYILGGAPDQAFDVLVGDGNMSVTLNATDPLEESWAYNWTSAGGLHNISFERNGTEGEIGFVVADADGDVLWECACDASAAARTVNGTAGNWTVTVQARGFAGEFRIDIAEAQAKPVNVTEAPPGPDEPDDAPDGNTTAEGNATAGLDGDPEVGAKDQEAPLPVVVPLAAAAIVAWSRRRFQ